MEDIQNFGLSPTDNQDVSSGDFPLEVGDLNVSAQNVEIVPINTTINSTILNIFDRAVAGSEYHYYVAYMPYNGNPILYMFDEYSTSGNTISFRNGVSVTCYSYQTGSSGNRQTHYAYNVSPASTSFSTGGDLCYTNCLDNYPILGDTARPWYPSVLLSIVLIALALWFVLRKSLRR